MKSKNKKNPSKLPQSKANPDQQSQNWIRKRTAWDQRLYITKLMSMRRKKGRMIRPEISEGVMMMMVWEKDKKEKVMEEDKGCRAGNKEREKKIQKSELLLFLWVFFSLSL